MYDITRLRLRYNDFKVTIIVKKVIKCQILVKKWTNVINNSITKYFYLILFF